MKLLKFKQRLVIDKNDWKKKFIYWIEYKFFYILIHIVDPKLKFGIKVGWFGLLMHFDFLKRTKQKGKKMKIKINDNYYD